MKPEVYFIKYAFPCSHILHDIRKEVDKQGFKDMEEAAINNKIMDRELLEKIFFRAFERITKIAEEMGKSKWDIDVIKEYFRIRHNPVLDASDYPESFKEMCKVFEGEVVEKTQDNEVVVKYGKKRRKVKKDYFQDLNIGDKVTIHWQYAIEKVV